MATVIHQQPVFVRPAPVTKKISVPTSKKRSREETVNKSEMMEKYSSDFAAYIKLEAKFLASTSEVSALNTFQQMRDLLIQVPAVSVLVGKNRLLQMAKSKRSINPGRWSEQMAKSFGKLIMTLVMSLRRFESTKRIKMMNTSVSSPRNSVAAMHLLALASAGSSSKKKEEKTVEKKSSLVVKIKIPAEMRKKKE